MPLIVPVLIINLFVVVITNMIFSKKQSKYNEKYKTIVISKIMNNFYDSLEYFPQKPMPEYIYKGLKYEYYNKYKSEDYFEAQIDNKYSIQMAEVMAQEEETYRDSDGKTHTRTTTKFHGLFGKIVMQKSIKSELRIMQNGKLLFDKKLKMDSSEFEKYFDVKASNPIVGMQLLTADVMEELIQFENKTKMKTLGNIVPDCWIYIQDEKVKLLRVQIFNNWSPYLVKNPKEEVWLGAEYTCSMGDEFWNLSDEETMNFVSNELECIGMIDKNDIIDYHVERIEKAYPSYFDTYLEIDKLIEVSFKNVSDIYSNLDKSDCEIVKNFFKDIGMSDAKSEYERCELYISLLNTQIAEAEKNYTELGKLYKNIGFLSGVFICILLL